jgi:hypothetical protein
MRCIFLILLLFFPITEAAAEPTLSPNANCAWDTCVPRSRLVGASELPLRSLVPFRYWGFKVYVAALYASPSVLDIEKALGVSPMRLELYYYRSFTAEDFISSGQQVLEQNPNAKLTELQPQLEQINRLYQAVAPGDSYALTYDPAQGLTLSLNDSPKGTISGSEFARAYLGIWLSRYSLSPKLTEQLTGQRAE